MTFKSAISIAAAGLLFCLPVTATAQEDISAGTVVATVNGTEITLGHMLVFRQRLPQQYQQLPPNVLFDGVLDQLVQQTLLAEGVETLSTESQVTLDNELRAIKATDALTKVVDAATTEEALQETYDNLYGAAEPETEFNASHILVPTEEEAAALVTELEGGADFAELAKEKSTGPSGPRGGELGWFGSGQMVAPFEEAVAAMEVGAISAPVETQFGWHVIRLNETRIKDAPSLEDVRGQIQQELQQKVIEAHLEELTEGADITRVTTEEIDPAALSDFSLLED